MYVGQPSEFPAINQKAIILQPGQEHFLSLTTQVISASPKGRRHSIRSWILTSIKSDLFIDICTTSKSVTKLYQATGFSSKSYMQSQMGSLLWLFLYFTIFVYKLNKVDWKIRSLTATERNCYFSGEGKLEFYEVYSYDNCVLECKIKTNQHKFNCTPWFLPHRFNWVKNLNLLINKIFSQKYGTVCDPWKGKEFMILFDKTSTGLETKRFCKFWWQGWLAVKS